MKYQALFYEKIKLSSADIGIKPAKHQLPLYIIFLCLHYNKYLNQHGINQLKILWKDNN